MATIICLASIVRKELHRIIGFDEVWVSFDELFMAYLLVTLWLWKGVL